MSDTSTELQSGLDEEESLQQSAYPLAAILIGLICAFGITTNLIIVYRVVITYVKNRENIHTADMYVFHKAIFDLLLLMSSPCYVISVLDGHRVYLFPLQCRILVSTDFLAILLSNHVIIGIVFERYGRRIEKSGKPIIMSRTDTTKHFQANVLYSLMITVAIVFVGDEIIWRGIPSCGYDWPIGQNYHAVIYAFLFGIVYCISYLLFIYWALDLLKQKFFGSRQFESVVPQENECRRDKVALLFLLVNFCCWTPFWGYHIYVMIHYYQIRPTIHIPGGYHTDEILVSTLVYLSASINIIPCALLIKDWTPRVWLKSINDQSNVTVLPVNSAMNFNQTGVSSLTCQHHETLPNLEYHRGDNHESGDVIELSDRNVWARNHKNSVGSRNGEDTLHVITSPTFNNTLGVPSTSY